MSLLNEYITKGWSSKQLESELINLIKKYNQYRDTYLFVYSSAINKNIPERILNQEDYFVIADLLRGVDLDSLDFYVETPGGSAEAVEEIVNCLRKRTSKISYVVTGEAKSAGTILVLSGDEILMSETGSLGPIDAQMKIGRSIISAHDYMEWVNEKQDESEKKGRLNPFDATMVAQINPGELKGVYHALKYAEDLVKEWLPKYKFRNWKETETRKIKVTEEMKIERAEEIARELYNRERWRSHGRSIKIKDLDDIGLKITNIDKDSKLADITYRIQTVCKMLFETTSTFKIFATADAKIFRQAVPMKRVSSPSKKSPGVATFDITCNKCGNKHQFYVKFVDDPKIDKDFKKKGFKKFPLDNKFECECGETIDLGGIRNQLELETGKSIIL